MAASSRFATVSEDEFRVEMFFFLFFEIITCVFILKQLFASGYIGVTSSILIGYKHAANSCLLCFSYVILTNNRFYICRIDIIPTDNSFMHAEVTSRNTLTSSFISFVMAELSSGICIIKQLLNSVFAC